METQLAPGFLVASPSLRDPMFQNSVIFLLEHENDEGTFGLVINKEADIDLIEVFDELDIPVLDRVRDLKLPPVVEGGPVTPELGWVIHTPDWTCAQTKVFADKVAVTASREILEAIAADAGPDRFWFCLGYSGWGARQLLGEMKEGAWLHVPFDEDLIFTIPFEDRWKKAISKLGIDPAFLSPTVGGA